MMDSNNSKPKTKISPAFKARLEHLKPQQRIRVIVMLHLRVITRKSTQRQSRAERQAAIDAIRKSGESVLPDLDKILQQFGGKRLADSVNALGSVPVETTAAGVIALADYERVSTILEDQKISLLSDPKHQ